MRSSAIESARRFLADSLPSSTAISCKDVGCMTRRGFAFAMTCVAIPTRALTALTEEQGADPWPTSDLMAPLELAKILNSSKARPAILCVAFPVLYRKRHIIHAEFAGPGNKPEGIEDLKSASAKLDKNTEVVLYCGCCPMVRCPNIRPAYRTMKELGFSKVRVLNLADSFHTDWVSRGYPVEEQLGVPISAPR
jgi:thiosulfate/3-mercaptopyruvate sulfurtransferase